MKNKTILLNKPNLQCVAQIGLALAEGSRQKIYLDEMKGKIRKYGEVLFGQKLTEKHIKIIMDSFSRLD